jgi:hypothetical protein
MKTEMTNLNLNSKNHKLLTSGNISGNNIIDNKNGPSCEHFHHVYERIDQNLRYILYSQALALLIR